MSGQNAREVKHTDALSSVHRGFDLLMILNFEWPLMISIAVLAEISLGSPWKLFISIIREYIYRIKVSKKTKQEIEKNFNAYNLSPLALKPVRKLLQRQTMPYFILSNMSDPICTWRAFHPQGWTRTCFHFIDYFLKFVQLVGNTTVSVGVYWWLPIAFLLIPKLL